MTRRATSEDSPGRTYRRMLADVQAGRLDAVRRLQLQSGSTDGRATLKN